MAEVESPVPAHAIVLPYTLWPERGALSTLDLPALQAWCAKASCVPVTPSLRSTIDQPSLSLPHEWALAAQLGWPLVDGLLPWAAQAAVQSGLAQAGDGSAWGWVSLCHWQISHGLATLTDPADLSIDAATDAALFAAMQPFFAEDGLVLHRHLPGVWLVQSPGLARLPTASLARVVGDDVDAWLVGSHTRHADAAQVSLWRRLQNEMQMLLYTHAVNAQRQVPINSFWLHGTGGVPSGVGLTFEGTSQSSPELAHALADLRRAYLAQHFPAWAQAWQRLQAPLMHAKPEAVVLCGAHTGRLLMSHSFTAHMDSRLPHAVHTSGVARVLSSLGHVWRGVMGRAPTLADVLSESANATAEQSRG